MKVVLMKSRVISLYSAMLNTHYGLSAGKYYYIKKKQRLWEPLVIVASMGWLLVLAVWFAWMLTEQLFLGGLAFGQPHLALISGTLIVSVLGLFFGFFNVLSTFYFSNDLSILLAWPLRSWEILLAKLGVIVTGQYILNALFLLPIGIRYGLLARVGVGYVVSAFVVFLVLPVIPLVIASALSVVLMRLVNLSRYRDKLTLIGGILLLVIVFGGTYWLQQNVGTDDPSVLLEQLLSQADGLVKAVGRVFPPSVWAAQAMAYADTSQGWINLLYLVASSALGLIVLYVLGEKVFLQGVIAGLEGSRGGKRRKKVVLEHVERGAFLTLLSTERKLFVRDPNFALNGLIGYVLLPVMALLPLFGQNLEGNPFEQLNFGGNGSAASHGRYLAFLHGDDSNVYDSVYHILQRRSLFVDCAHSSSLHWPNHPPESGGCPGCKYRRLCARVAAPVLPFRVGSLGGWFRHRLWSTFVQRRSIPPCHTGSESPHVGLD